MSFISSIVSGLAKPVTSLVGGILGSNASKNAANAEVTGAQQAQALELQNQQAAQGSQATATAQNQAAEQPYQAAGSTAANNLTNILNTPFQAPTLAQAEQTPGYQFTLGQGTQAINENAAANGTLLSGNTGVALQNYGQGLASTTYQQDYQNALNTYQANANTALQGTQLGQSSTAELGQLGQAGAQNLANVDLTGAQQQAQQLNNAAAARASGYLGSAAAWSNAAGGLAHSLAGGFNNLDSTGSSSAGEQVQNFFQGL